MQIDENRDRQQQAGGGWPRAVFISLGVFRHSGQPTAHSLTLGFACTILWAVNPTLAQWL